VPAGPGGTIACIVDCSMPTASTTEWAPSPFVSALIFATPSSPRSSTSEMTNDATTKSPTLTFFTAEPTSSTTPTYS
jgi:hypothetical protein